MKCIVKMGDYYLSKNVNFFVYLLYRFGFCKINIYNCDTIIFPNGHKGIRKAKILFAKKIRAVSMNDIKIYQGEKTIITTTYLTTG